MLVLHDDHRSGRRLVIAATERTDGDVHPLRVPPDELAARQRRATGTVWAMADQVHGREVWYVSDPSGTPPADVVVADGPAVAMWSADCATLLLVTARGRLVGVHAGWRGLSAGVVDVAVAAARCDDDVELVAAGPMIRPCCYEFGERELEAVAVGVGAPAERLTARTTRGALALDVPAALASALAANGLGVDVGVDDCTGCSPRWWSHRTGVDAERQALVGWWT